MSAEIEFENEEIKDFLNNLSSRLKNIKDGERKYVGILSALVYRDIVDHFEK